MLTYLINVTDDLFTISLVLGTLLAFTDRSFGEKTRLIPKLGLLLGLIIAAIRAYITNTRRLVGGWKVGVYGYVAALILFVLFIIAFVIYARKTHGSAAVTETSGDPEGIKPSGAVHETVLASVMGLLLAAFLYGAVPNVYVYPFKFDIGSNSVLSTDYLFRLGGYLLGLIVCFVAGLAAYKLTSLAAKKGYHKLMDFMFLGFMTLYSVFCFAKLMLVLVPRKIVNSPALFLFGASSNNHSERYTYIAFLLLLAVGAVLWVRSYTSKEPYRTKAEHRKQRALWRTGKRFTIVTLCCFIMSILCATWFVDLNTEEIHEAPVEEAEIVKNASGEDDYLVVPVEAVIDGHLHRFGYEYDGRVVRFIIVLKQEGTTNFGVGLDACDICGEAGYYENKDGQVVCKKCDVVMNRTTIGMKGGCNPIIIDYDFDGSTFTVPVSEMIKYADKFSK